MQFFSEDFASLKQKTVRSGLFMFGFIGLLVFLVITNVGSSFALGVFQEPALQPIGAAQAKEKQALTPEQESVLRKELLSPGSFIFEGKVLDHSNLTDGTTTYGVLTVDIYQSYGAKQKCGQVAIRTQVVSGKIKIIKTGEVRLVKIASSKPSHGFGMFSCYYGESNLIKLRSTFLYLTESHSNAYLKSQGKVILDISNYSEIYRLAGKANVCKDILQETEKYSPNIKSQQVESLVTPKKA